MIVNGMRKHTELVSPYVHGKTIPQVQAEYGLETVVKLSSNENPYGPFTQAQEAMKAEVVGLFEYPDSSYLELKEIIGDLHGLAGDCVTLGHGAGGIIESIARTMIDEGDEVILPTQTYSLYRSASLIMGAKVHSVSLDSEYRIDIARYIELINAKTKLIWVCNPNNPTGTVITTHDIEQLLAHSGDNTWVVVDEAYAEFADVDVLPDCERLIQEGKNLMMVRTFSKAYALAGARIGYMLAREAMIQAIDTVSLPFSSNRVSLQGAIATIKQDKAEFTTCITTMADDRLRVSNALTDLGCIVTPSQANFIFFETPYDALELTEALLKKGVIVRPCAAWGYPKHLRVTIGTTADMNAFLNVYVQLTSQDIL